MKYHEDKEAASRYLSDLLTEQERAEYERHIAECPECAAEVERYRRMMGFLRNLPQIKAPASLHASVMAKISPGAAAPQRVSILRSWRFRAVAALLIAGAGVVVMFRILTPTPPPVRPQAPGESRVADNKAAAIPQETSPAAITGASLIMPPDMPGGYDVAVLTSALNRVDNALYALNVTDLKAFAGKDQTAFVDFAATAAMPDIQNARLTSRADNVVFMQMAQKRVVANAFEKARDMNEVAPILSCYNDAATQQQYVSKDVLSNVSPHGRFQADSAREPAAGAAPPGAAEKPADEYGKGDARAFEEAAPPPAGDDEKAKEEAERARLEALAAKARELQQTQAETDRLSPDNAAQNMALQQRFQRRIDGDKTEMALNFRQSIVLSALTPDGKKRALNDAEKNDIKLVFDCLPTLEDYQSAQFTPGGITVRLSEAEFLRLLKYLREMADVKAEVGPIYAELLPAASIPPAGARNEADEDPYAVDVRIIFE